MTLDSRLSASTFQSQKLTFLSSFCSWNFSFRIVDISELYNRHFQMYSGWIEPFLTFSRTNDPFAGTLSPSTHPSSISPMCSGLAQVLKSALGMAYRLEAVSIVSGRIVTTRKLQSFAFYANVVARQCTPLFAIEQPSISGCGSLQTAAAPVKAMRPWGVRYLVARWAARMEGYRLHSLMFFTLVKQSLSLMLPPAQPPAVTRMALKICGYPLRESRMLRWLSAVESCESRSRLECAWGCGRKSMLTTLCLLNIDTTLCPS